MVPSGLVSLMPQAWITKIPISRIRSMIARGAADPPTTMRLSFSAEASRPGVWSICARKPSQTVGTPSEKVQPSVVARSHRLAPSSFGPGSTSLAPHSAEA